jgi:hypothetical protein
MDRIIKQVQAANNNANYFIFFWHSPQQTEMVMNALKKNSFQEMQHIYWYKSNHFTPTPVSSYTSSVEMATIGFYVCRKNVPWNVSTDARKRHNHITLPTLTNYEKDAAGEKVNNCQKPPGLMKWICGNHCAPNSTVLVIGPGAGGEVLGAVSAGCNVVAIESDERQFDCLLKIANVWKVTEMAKTPEKATSAQTFAFSQTVDDEQPATPVVEPPEEKQDEPTAETYDMSGPTCSSCGKHFLIGEEQLKCNRAECEVGVFHKKCTGMSENNTVWCIDHVNEYEASHSP